MKPNTPPDFLDAELRSWRDESPDAETAEMLTKTMRDNWHAMSENDDVPASEPMALLTVRRSWWIKSGVLVATAASIALLVTWISQPHTVYAQALAAIKAARSVHAVAQRFAAGQYPLRQVIGDAICSRKGPYRPVAGRLRSAAGVPKARVSLGLMCVARRFSRWMAS